MKKMINLTLAALLFVMACKKEESANPTPEDTSTNLHEQLNNLALMGLDSPFLNKDSANRMIASYLEGRDPSTDLKSLIVDANALRYYLEDENITHVKLMFAHKLSYINAGGEDNYDGLNYNSLTIVIAGFDDNNNYIYTDYDAVLDYCQPCPYNCPASGTASNDLLQ